MSAVPQSRINGKCLVRDSNQEGRSQNSQMQWGLYAQVEEQEFERGIEVLEAGRILLSSVASQSVDGSIIWLASTDVQQGRINIFHVSFSRKW